MAYYNPQAFFTPGEQMIENSLKFMFRNHKYCKPGAFFKFAVCVCGLFLYVFLSFFF
jgi:hypothetical protein